MAEGYSEIYDMVEEDGEGGGSDDIYEMIEGFTDVSSDGSSITNIYEQLHCDMVDPGNKLGDLQSSDGSSVANIYEVCMLQ